MKQNISFRCTLDTRYKKKNSASFPVKLMITIKEKDRYIQSYIATEFESTKAAWKKMHSNRPELLENQRDELRAIEIRAADVAEKIVPFDVEKFKSKYNSKNNFKTIAGAFKGIISELHDEGRVGTIRFYSCAMVSLEKFKKDSLLSDVTIKFLKDYQRWMLDEGNSITTTGMHLRALRVVISRAITEGELDKDLYPFGKGKYSPPSGVGNKRWLEDETLAKLYNYDGPLQRAKDYWFFSYFANGMNFKDICRLKYTNIDTDKNIILYQRAKTERTKKEKEPIRVDYTEDLRRIVKEYGTGGKDDDYIFPILQKGITPEREMQLKDQFIHVTNNDLKEIAKYLKISPFTTYASRHSWAQLQMNSGLSTVAIGKMLGHADYKTTESYLGSLNVKTIKLASQNAASFKKPVAKVVNI